MRLTFNVGVYQQRRDGDEAWTALVPIRYPAYLVGSGEGKLRERMVDKLRELLKEAPPQHQELFQLAVGSELHRVIIDVKTKDGRVHGTIPLIVEPRWTSETEQRYVAYHPRRRDTWFVCDDLADLQALAQQHVREQWDEIDEDDAEELLTVGKDRLATIALTTEVKSLLDLLPSRKKDDRTAATAPTLDRVLHTLGVDETHRAATNQLRLGVPRSPYRERLGYLLGGPRPRSTAIVGPPGSGKTELLRRWIADRLVEDGYPLHKNMDRVHHVWRLSGKRLIAGMSYLGQWEERCLALLDEAKKHRGILWIEDLHLFGRLGQSRQSERSFADFFRGPVRRGDLCVVAELTQEQFARLERDSPGLAEALALVAVPAASNGETAQLLLHEQRALEVRLRDVALHPFATRTALELGGALFPWRAKPGVAIEIIRRVAEDAATRKLDHELGPSDVLAYLARTTGLSAQLISLDAPLDAAEVEAQFAARVIGQPVATRAAADVILKVRAGLADPGRPVSTMLFTGPTGTGKTELATAIAEYLYGDQSRLVRVDMGELSGPDAVARLIGDRWNADGLLTSRVRAQPFCVVLLDEIEKAHRGALHLLLQLFDEGRLTDASGEVASFASAVVIMTSNLGSKNASPIGFGDARERILADVARAVREFFPIELFNRIDQVVPFSPLTDDVAAKVVDKELAKLLARRGLRERNTYVYAGAAVRKLAVADAFDPRYGARTVKRWLEDHVGGSLVDVLASAPPSRLRIIRLAEVDGRIGATLEPLDERAALPGPYRLEGALDLPTSGLDGAIAAGAAALRRVLESPLLAHARRAAHGELQFYVDDLVQRATALGDTLGVHVERQAEPEHDSGHEPDYVYKVVDKQPFRDGREARFRLSGPASPSGGRPAPNRDALIAAIAEAMLIDRALPSLLDPDAHAVTVTLSRVGSPAGASGIATVLRALAQPAWFDDAACVHKEAVLEITEVARLGPTISASRDVVLVLRGLFVGAALAGEHGTWVVRDHGGEPDMIRVNVLAGAPAGTAADVLRAHLAARAELERVLEAGGALPPNPDALLPVTRSIVFRRPLRSGEPYGVEMEDFSTGWVDNGLYRDVPTALRRAWHLAWSRAPEPTP
jgi:ATP-dependent Clp protease ATP-binding subunit ClpA/ATP-dependent Clp protease ATP-binding subunit ClpC|nr:AAA family ATPase [Kofleriaceae bacterium]